MLGILVVSHGRLAAEMILALEHVVGTQRSLAAVCIGPDDNMEARRQEILEKIVALNDGTGVIVLTDMFGGTPSNLAISVMEKGKVEVIAGVNLPMLIKLASVRETQDISSAVVTAQEAGRKYINIASHVLGEVHAERVKADTER